MIGWYAHHHGMGHVSRAAAVIPLLDDTTVFSSRPLGVQAPVVCLPLDVDPPPSAWMVAQPTPDVLHYAPLGVPGLRCRMGMMASWMATNEPGAFVVDVSVEVSLLARLMSIPTVVMRQHGYRDDAPHRAAYDCASLLLAPYPDWMEEDWVDEATRRKTVYAGGFSRFDGRPADRGHARDALGLSLTEQIVVVMPGDGGRMGWPVHQAAGATPGWRWVVLGDVPGRPGISAPGWVEDPWPWLCAADVVVTHAGHNAVMEAAASGTPLVVIPQDRPFDEQRHKSNLLEARDVCVVQGRWPAADRWPAVLDQACCFDTDRLRQLVDGNGARQAAAALQAFLATSGRGST